MMIDTDESVYRVEVVRRISAEGNKKRLAVSNSRLAAPVSKRYLASSTQGARAM